MLDLLVNLASQYNELDIRVVHYNHRLQHASDEWLVFCEKLAAHYQLPFFSCSDGVVVEKSSGVEASARKARYQWFSKVMSDCLEQEVAVKNTVLLTAHHCDDQAETLLLNMLRGTGLNGLRGIAAIKDFSVNHSRVLSSTISQTSQILMRPLLGFTKCDLQEYASDGQLSWINDPSNQDVAFRRNAIRHQVMPELHKIRPDASKQLSKLSHRVSDAQQILQEVAASDLSFTQQEGFCPMDKSYGLSLEGLRVFSVSRQINAIRYWLEAIQFPSESEMDLLKVMDWSLNGAASGAELRRGQRLYRFYNDVLYVMPHREIDECSVGLRGELLWSDLSQSLDVSHIFDGDSVGWQISCEEDSQWLEAVVLIKPASMSKSIYLPGKKGHIQAKNCFQEYKVPPWRRQSALFVTTQEHELLSIIGGRKQKDFYLEYVESH